MMKKTLNIKVLGNVAPFSSLKKNCSGYLINDKKTNILLDCGFGISKYFSQAKDMENLTIIISHFHKDHYSDIYSIGYASYCFNKLGLLSKKINVYIPKMFENEEGYEDYKLFKCFKENYFNIIEYEKDTIIEFNGFKIDFYLTNHIVKNYAIRILYNNKKISYSGDMGFFNIDEISEFFSNSDLLICETTYLISDNKDDINHLNTKQATLLSIKSKVKKLYFSHTWPKFKRILYYDEIKQFLGYNNIEICRKNKIYF